MAISKKVLVTIVCITYNQKRVIKDALEGFVMQKTTFPFQAIISDDCSTDGTTKIIEKYAKKYPDIIKPIYRKKNLGPGKNFSDTFKKATGKYIALCEGDDYWTDPQKLQRQVDYMEIHPECTLCHHTVVKKFEDEPDREDEYISHENDIINLETLLAMNNIQTASVMYRKIDYAGYDASGIMPGDWYLHLFHAKSGAIGFIDKPMAVYRVHRGSVWYYKKGEKVKDVIINFSNKRLQLFFRIIDLFPEEQYQIIITDTLIEVMRQIMEGIEIHELELDEVIERDIQKQLIPIYQKKVLYDKKVINWQRHIENELHNEVEGMKQYLDQVLSSRRYKLAEKIAKVFGRHV